MNSCTGVGKFLARPIRTTAPLCASSSDGRPAIKSRCIEAVPSGGNDSASFIVSATDSLRAGMPQARARPTISCIARSSSDLASGTLRITPAGARVTAPTPPNEAVNSNFSQSATWILSGTRVCSSAVVRHSTNFSSRGVRALFRSPRVITALDPACRTTPGAITMAKMTQSVQHKP